MKKRILFGLSIFVLAFCLLCSATETTADTKSATAGNGTASPKGSYTIEDDKDGHFLVFLVEGDKKARMLVREGDTLESLKPYFPTIPEKTSVYSNKDRYVGYWEDKGYWEDGDGKAAYLEKWKELEINAYYIKRTSKNSNGKF